MGSDVEVRNEEVHERFARAERHVWGKRRWEKELGDAGRVYLVGGPAAALTGMAARRATEMTNATERGLTST